MKKLNIILPIIVLIICGCDRSRKGPMSEPGASITSISGYLSMMDKNDYPYKDLYAKVADNNGNPVTDLKVGNITIAEDGNPAIPLDVEASIGPLSIVLILDRSGSMSGDPTTALNEAASGFVDSLSARDFVEIIDFGTTVQVSQSFTNSKSSVKDVINNGDATMGLTALYDAIVKGVQDIQNIGGYRVIVAMTDGGDCASTNTLNDAISLAISYNQPVNTIGYGTSYNPANLLKIASDTGGLYDSASSSSELYQVYQKMVPTPVEDHVKIKFRSLTQNAGGATIYILYGLLSCSFSMDYPDTD